MATSWVATGQTLKSFIALSEAVREAELVVAVQ
jgi:hypothetical protein